MSKWTARKEPRVTARGAPGADVQEILDRLLAAVRPLGAEPAPVWEAAGRISAAKVHAPADVPGFPRAAMDGYVCHDADVADATETRPAVLRITGAGVMGEPPGAGPARGEAWSITTGTAAPRRGDRILPLEVVRVVGPTLRLEREPPQRRHILEPGEEIRRGDLLAVRGEPLTPAVCGALAACGVATVSVHRRPRVALVATGSELVELDAGGPRLPAGSIVNSNAVTLAAELAAAGCIVEYRGIVADRPRDIARAFAALRRRCDVVLSTGGVSVGRYDLVHRTWLELGARRYAGRVDLKPGGPFFAGRAGTAWVIGLSGTPVACLAAFHLLVRPVVRRLAGARFAVRPLEMRPLAEGWPRPTERLRALWGRVDDAAGVLRILAKPGQGRLTMLAAANALVLLPAATPPLAAGARVAVLRLDRPEDRHDLRIASAMPGPLVIGVTGASGSGKTAAIAGLIRRLTARRLHVAAVKHAAHGFDIDRPASDSARMMQAGAVRVVLAGPTETALRIAGEVPFPSVLRAAAGAAGEPAPDIVLVEGFGAAGHPIVQIGAPTSGAAAGEPWKTIPPVDALSHAEFEETLDGLASSIVALLDAVPAPR
jgi:molybdopterin molybdotransferase